MKRPFQLLSFCLCAYAVGLPVSGCAETISDKTFQQYQSPFMEFVKADYDPNPNPDWRDRHPTIGRYLSNDWLKYNPAAANERTSSACRSDQWLEKNQSKQPYKEVVDSIENYVQKCSSTAQTGWTDILSNTYLAMMLKLEPKDHPYARFVVFHMPNGIRLKGYLGLKGDGKKRPLVIVRLGIFSSATQFLPERFLFMQLFEQAPFNILILESDSNKEFIHRNKTLALGGFDEGIQNFQVAQRLQDEKEPLSRIIEGVHLAGISMGGHGVLFASLLSSLEHELPKEKNKKPVLQTAMAFCPLINYRTTVDAHLFNPAEASLFNYWVSDRLHGIEDVVPEIDNAHFFQSLMSYMESDYRGPRTLDWQTPLPAKLRANKSKYWVGNDFWPFYKDVQTPVLIFATVKDPIVPYALNSGKLFRHEMDVGDSKLRVIPLQEGWHCSLPAAYQWKPMTTLIQSYILQQSAFQPEKMKKEVELSSQQLQELKAEKFPPAFLVEPGANEGELSVQVQLSKKEGTKLGIPFKKSDMGYADADSSKAKFLYERWFAQNLHFRLEEEKGSQPSHLELSWTR